MDEQLKSNLTSGKHWLRFFYMVFFLVCLQVARLVMWVLVGLQFLFALITGGDNEKLRAFGSSLSQFIFQSLKFLTYNSEDKPFPFDEWPEPEKQKPLEGEVEIAEAEPHEINESEVEEAEVIVDDNPTEVELSDNEPEAETEKS